ncbi:helix-turn-helix domain-containing protein [Rhodovibrionaceae bacterium A322]
MAIARSYSPTGQADTGSQSSDFEGAALDLRSYGGQVAKHRHAHHQMVLPIEGLLAMEVDGHGGQVTGSVEADLPGFAPWGEAAFVSANRWHAFSAQGDNRFLVLDLDQELTGPSSSLCPAFRDSLETQAFLSLDPASAQLIRFLLMRLQGGVRNRAGFARQASGLLLQSLSDGYGGQAEVSLPQISQRVQRALAFLAQNYHLPLTVDLLAQQAGLSVSRFHEVFRAVLGRTPQQHILALRLAEAERRLLTTAQPLAEVALDCGFSDQSALTRAFRREKNITPAALRRQKRLH